MAFNPPPHHSGAGEKSYAMNILWSKKFMTLKSILLCCNMYCFFWIYCSWCWMLLTHKDKLTVKQLNLQCTLLVIGSRLTLCECIMLLKLCQKNVVVKILSVNSYNLATCFKGLTFLTGIIFQQSSKQRWFKVACYGIKIKLWKINPREHH